MEYTIRQICLGELVEWVRQDVINLQPPYQRNFIWTPKDQKLLIDSIMRGYPLPNFFIYKKDDGKYDMVDGQQRATTICKFIKNEFRDSSKHLYGEINQSQFLSYKLNVTEITNIGEGESLEEFYSLVNKRGIRLNPAEVNKAQYHDSQFLTLVNSLMDLQVLTNLDIFSSKTVQRMNDRSLIEEVVAYLFKGEITDKRIAVDDLFEATLPPEKIEQVNNSFNEVIRTISMLNEVKPINQTRFKQRNDFYTLFCFLHMNAGLSDEVIKEQYRYLIYLDENEYIRPTNEDCETLKEYAYHCVTQSNSKLARKTRLEILESILLVKERDENERQEDVYSYVLSNTDKTELPTKKIEGYLFVDLEQL